MSPIDAAIEEIKSLAPGEKFSCRKIAEKYGVERTTLARRHQAKNQPRSVEKNTTHSENSISGIQSYFRAQMVALDAN
jgi:hypothetical protein